MHYEQSGDHLFPVIQPLRLGGECGGLSLRARIAPHAPQEPPGEGRFDSPFPWPPSPTDQGRGPAGPLTLEPSPGSSVWERRPEARTSQRASGHVPPAGAYYAPLHFAGLPFVGADIIRLVLRPRARGLLRSKGRRLAFFFRTALGCFQRGGTAVPPLWSFQGGCPEGGKSKSPLLALSWGV